VSRILRLAQERVDRGEPCVLATVVWRRAPSSGKTGSRALIGADGSVTGWIGGACAEPMVVREAMRALADGEPRLLCLGPEDALDDRRGGSGMVSVPIACQSEGALEVYVEPLLPAPQLVVVGRSPAAETLARMAKALGWRTVLVDDGGSPVAHAGVGKVLTTLDLGPAGVDGASMIVVATQGHYDEAALEKALATPAAYVGLIASRKRAESVLGYLRQRGTPDDALARVRSPAGLDLGHVSHEEIAVAVLAELVQLRAAGALGSGVVAVTAREEAVDPICGMVVEVEGARHTATRDGVTYYFCCAGCQERFVSQGAHTGFP
jgi:xanthine dehydrogenase accessory factor